MTIKTNMQWRQFKYRDEVPESVLKEQFDYQDENVFDGYFCYRNYWYHLDMFMRIPSNSKLIFWDGYHGDSFFSGVLIRLSDDSEQYQVATYYS